MEPLLQIGPLALLILAVIWLVRRGRTVRPDADGNRSDTGGGPGGSHTAD